MQWDVANSFLQACLTEASRHWMGLRRQLRPDPSRVSVTIGPSGAPIIVAPDQECAGISTDLRSDDVIVVTPALGVTIRPPDRPAWDEQGWRRVPRGRDLVYEGEYRVRDGRGILRTFPGRLLERGGTIATYVADLPARITRHAKGPCFQLTSPPWFIVHWHRHPTCADDAILYVERILHEVLQ